MVQGTMPDLSRVVPALQSAVESQSDAVREALASVAPQRTGAFAAGIETEVVSAGDGVTLTATASDPLATWITQGTRAHEIRPVNAKWLRFEPSGGGVVYAKVVNHPGTPANDFVEVAWDSTIEGLIDDAIDQALTEALG